MPRAKLNENVQWKHALAALAIVVSMLAGYALWILGRAEAAVNDGTAAISKRVDASDGAIQRIESKIDRILFILLEKEKHDGN